MLICNDKKRVFIFAHFIILEEGEREENVYDYHTNKSVISEIIHHDSRVPSALVLLFLISHDFEFENFMISRL